MSTTPPTLLAHAFMARDVVREALGISAAVIYSGGKGVIRIVVPLRAPPKSEERWGGTHLGNLYLSLSMVTKEFVKCTAKVEGTVRSFKLSRNNLIGYLGLTHIPLLVTQADDELDELNRIRRWITRHLRARINFGWNEEQDAEGYRRAVTATLIPWDNERKDHPVYKVWRPATYDATAAIGWTFARAMDDGASQWTKNPEAGNKVYQTYDEALYAAEFDAITKGHLPLVNPDSKHKPDVTVLMWSSIYIRTTYGFRVLHSALLSNSQSMSITYDEPGPSPLPDALYPDNGPPETPIAKPYVVTLCASDGTPTDAGSHWYETMDQAVHAALTSIRREAVLH